jgi:4-hydroxybenzoyl-CoA thioesterase
MLDLQRQHQARVRIRTRKRIEDAVAAETYTAEGAAPRTTRHILVSRADVHRDGAVHGGRVMRWIDDAANDCAADWSGVRGLTSYVVRSASAVPSPSVTRWRSLREWSTPDRAAFTSVSA